MQKYLLPLIIVSGLASIAYGYWRTQNPSVTGAVRVQVQKPITSLSSSQTVFRFSFSPEKDTQEDSWQELPTDILAANQVLASKAPELKVKSYLPWAKSEKDWLENEGLMIPSSEYEIGINGFNATLTTTLHPQAQYYNWHFRFAGIQFYYAPEEIAACLTKKSEHSFIFWQRSRKRCLTLEDLGGKFAQHGSHERMVIFSAGEKVHTFLIDQSRYPIEDFLQTKPDFSADYVLFDRSRWEKEGQFLLLENKAALYRDEKWQVMSVSDPQDFEIDEAKKIRLQIVSNSREKFPEISYQEWNKNNLDIDLSQRIQAALLEYKGKSYWISSQRPMNIGPHWAYIDYERSRLPFAVVLDGIDFKFVEDKPIIRGAIANLTFDPEGQKQARSLTIGEATQYAGYRFYWPANSAADPHNTFLHLQVSSLEGRLGFWLGGGLWLLAAFLFFMFRTKKETSSPH